MIQAGTLTRTSLGGDAGRTRPKTDELAEGRQGSSVLEEVQPADRPSEAEELFLPSAELCRRIWATDPYGRVVLDVGGSIRYANGAAAAMTGRAPADLIGQSMADFIDPADVAMAFEAVAEIEGERSEADVGLPLVLGVPRPDGSVVHAEVGATNLLGEPGFAAISLRLRPYDSQRYLERFLAALVAGAPLDTNLMLLVQSLDHMLQQSTSAIVHGWTGRVFTGTATAGLCGALTGPIEVSPEDLDRLPWSRCVSSGELEFSSVSDLPEPVRAAAIDAGFRMCWAKPIAVPDEGTVAAIVVWRRLPGTPRIGHRHALERSVQAGALAFERRRSQALLVKAATLDALTGIPNRSHFFATLESTMDIGDPGRVGVLYLDLDGFKPVNDTHGHRVGDRLLVEVGAMLAANVRPGDMVARLGGDEFAVLCPDVEGEHELCAVADRVIQVLSRPMLLDGIEVLIGVSIGVALVTIHGRTQDEVLDAADAALYRAKREGRGRYRVALPR